MNNNKKAIELLINIIKICAAEPYTVTDNVIQSLTQQALALFEKPEECETCNGRGWIPKKITTAKRPLQCSKCDGWGWLPLEDSREYQETCPECGQTPCPRCKQPEAGEFTKNLRTIARKMRGIGILQIYTGDVVDAIKIEQACEIIEQLQAKLAEQAEEIKKYEVALEKIKGIEHYSTCKAIPIAEQALKQKGGEE